MYKSYTYNNAVTKARELLRLEGTCEATIHKAEDHWAFASLTEKQKSQHTGKFSICLWTDSPYACQFIGMGAIVSNSRQAFAVARIK